MSDEPVVSLDDVKIHFDNSKFFGLRSAGTVRAVDGVSLDIHENDVIALVGESGCGKTTLGKAAIGLHRPTEGTVSYRGQDVWKTKDRSSFWRNDAGEIPYSEIRRSLQMIHQDPGSSLNANYTVESLLSAPLRKWEPDLELADRQARIYGLLEYVGMTLAEDYANRYPHQLSGGEQQRVALIRALLVNPDLILADEAISALDVSLRVEVMDLLLALQEQFGTSFLFVSHDLPNARYLAERADGRIGVMYLGKLVEVGPPEQIINDPRHPYTKVLRWATGDMRSTREVEEPPLRSLDIPDPVDPPSGCSFHTRCPEAREACKKETPALIECRDGQRAACFREDEEHAYWDSDPLGEAEADRTTATDSEDATV